jgi:hypothetical protein
VRGEASALRVSRLALRVSRTEGRKGSQGPAAAEPAAGICRPGLCDGTRRSTKELGSIELTRETRNAKRVTPNAKRLPPTHRFVEVSGLRSGSYVSFACCFATEEERG